MTTDLERDLRHRLNTSADATGIDLDLDAILDEGGERLRAHNRRRTAVAGSLAALALVGGGLAVQSMHDNVPTPAHSPSPDGAGLVGSTVTLDTPDTETGEPRSLLVRVVAVRSDGAIDLTVTPRNAQRKPTHAPVPVTLATGRSTALLKGTPLCRLCFVGVIRGQAETFTTVGPTQVAGDPADGLLGSGPELLGGQALSVVAGWEQSEVPARAATGQLIRGVSGLVWRAVDGTVHDSAGGTLPSVTFESDGRRYVVFRASRYGIVGVTADGLWDTWQESAMRKQAPRADLGAQGDRSWSVTLLPAGSTIQSAVWTHAKSQEQAVKQLPGLGSVGWMSARADSATARATLVRFTYRTKAGKLVTVDNQAN